MKNIFVVIGISIMTAAALALENGELSLVTTMAPDHPCVKVNLSSEQILAIKDIVYKNSQARAQDEANLKKAMLDVEHVLTSSTSTKAEAEKAQSGLQHAIAALSKTASELDLLINYDVLRPDQRELGSMCAKSMHWFPQSSPATTTASLGQP
ncbi:MAG: hypothetical protein JNL11_07990 [Bdellovibrionaceae bacterium]|nr:hypothetical protein [Pseudobdellovibrionaceae bacterium]